MAAYPNLTHLTNIGAVISLQEVSAWFGNLPLRPYKVVSGILQEGQTEEQDVVEFILKPVEHEFGWKEVHVNKNDVQEIWFYENGQRHGDSYTYNPNPQQDFTEENRDPREIAQGGDKRKSKRRKSLKKNRHTKRKGRK